MWKQRSQNLKQAAIRPWLRSADILEGNIFVLSSLFKDIYPGKKLGLGSKIWLSLNSVITDIIEWEHQLKVQVVCPPAQKER